MITLKSIIIKAAAAAAIAGFICANAAFTAEASAPDNLYPAGSAQELQLVETTQLTGSPSETTQGLQLVETTAVPAQTTGVAPAETTAADNNTDS